MPGYESMPALKCPMCLVEVTPELMTAEADAHEQLTEAKQAEEIRTHSKSHFGAIKFQEIVVFMDPSERGASTLHRRTNCAHNNVLATFMQVPPPLPLAAPFPARTAPAFSWRRRTRLWAAFAVTPLDG